MKIHWSPRARYDLDRIVDYISKDDPRAAGRWLASIRSRTRSLGTHPRLGRTVPEVDRDDVRKLIVGSYRVLYRILPEVVEVIAVFEGHRLLPPDVEPDRS